MHLAPKEYQSLFDSSVLPLVTFTQLISSKILSKSHKIRWNTYDTFVNIKRLIAATKGLQLSKEEKDRNLVLNALTLVKENQKNVVNLVCKH